MNHGFTVLAGVVLASLLGCTGVEFEFDDDDTSATDDDVADDDVGDDDTDVSDDDTDVADDDVSDDDDSTPSHNWSWGQENSVNDADASLVGEASNGHAGGNLAVPGDVNGDGLNDLAVGDPYYSAGVNLGGKLYVVLGRASGWSLGESLVGHPSLVGEYEYMQLSDADAIGDINGDGLEDMILEPGFSYNEPPGGLYAVFGKTTGWSSDQPVTSADVYVSHADHPDSSRYLSNWGRFGDFDGDGIDDWLVSGQVSTDASVVSGASLATSVEVPTDALCAVVGEQSFRPIGDVNGDGLADVLSTSGTNSVVRLLFGRTGSFPHGLDMAVAADTAITRTVGQGFEEIQPVGDVNGDGMSDFAVAAGGGTGAGLYLFLGRATWPASLTEDDADVAIGPGQLGDPGEPIGDVSGDGLDDLVFIRGNDAFLVFGRTSWPSEIAIGDVDVAIERSPGTDELRVYQNSQQHRGDLDGDGLMDLLLYDPYTEVGGVEGAGKVWIFAGRTEWPPLLTSDDADVTFVGTVANQDLGTLRRSVVGDIDGDGRDDLIVSSYYHPTGTEEGETFIFFGQTR